MDTEITEKDMAKFMKFLEKKTFKAAKTDSPGKNLVIFREWESGFCNKLRVYRDTYKGKEVLSIRKFYREDEESDEWLPGKGVTFCDEDIEEIIEGLNTMLEWLEDYSKD